MEMSNNMKNFKLDANIFKFIGSKCCKTLVTIRIHLFIYSELVKVNTIKNIKLFSCTF